MIQTHSLAQIRRIIARHKRNGKTIGFVPTMGYLHEGHAALLRQCRKDNDLSVLSVFVNPLQFGPREDFRRYPRDKKHDETLAKQENVDIIFYPTIKTFYPSGYLTYVHVRELADHLCGPRRPGHFTGVTTVVAKLLNIVNPDILYLGQKDAQQAIIISRMIKDLNWPIAVRILKTVRAPDGLALSSRNRYLSVQDREDAVWIYRALQHAKRCIQHGQRQSTAVTREMRSLIQRHTRGHIDYIACVDGRTLKPASRLQGHILIALAVTIGQTRLIDNVQLRIPS